MKRSRTHIPLLVFAFSIALFVLCLAIYMRFQVGSMTKQAATALSKLSGQVANQAKDENLREVYDATAADRSRLPSFFIPDDEAVMFIESLERLGTSAGSAVNLSNISADDLGNKDEGTTGGIRTHIDATGSWAGVMKTLKLAEVLPYGATITNVSLISSGPQAAKAPEWKLSFDIEAGLIHALAASTQP